MPLQARSRPFCTGLRPPGNVDRLTHAGGGKPPARREQPKPLRENHLPETNEKPESRSSLLDAVAQHEAALLERLESANKEAEAIVESARAEAEKLSQERAAALACEIAERRREAEQARRQVAESIRASAEAEQEQTRQRLAARIEGLVDELAAMVLPKTGGGSGS